MSIGELLHAVEVQRRVHGARYNTIVCRPPHLEGWGGVDPATLRLIFAEHGLRLQVDVASPWNHAALLWIDPAPVRAAA